MSEQRQFTRIHFESPVCLAIGTDRLDVELMDISLKGALVALAAGAETPGIGAVCTLELELDDGVMIQMAGHIAHAEENHVGMRCDSIDLDSATHLRRLVELNLGDAALLDREFTALWTG